MCVRNNIAGLFQSSWDTSEVSTDLRIGSSSRRLIFTSAYGSVENTTSIIVKKAVKHWLLVDIELMMGVDVSAHYIKWGNSDT